MLRNSAAETFYGGFTASKIRRLIRRAVIFPADFRRTNIRRRIRRSAAAEGSTRRCQSISPARGQFDGTGGQTDLQVTSYKIHSTSRSANVVYIVYLHVSIYLVACRQTDGH